MSLMYDHAGGYPAALVALTVAALLAMLAIFLADRDTQHSRPGPPAA